MVKRIFALNDSISMLSSCRLINNVPFQPLFTTCCRVLFSYMSAALQSWTVSQISLITLESSVYGKYAITHD